MKIVLIFSLFLVSCKTAHINPDTMCIIHEKRLINGEFVEIYDIERRCND